MAAYAYTITLDQKTPEPVGTGWQMLSGEINVTAYNPVIPEIVEITRYFRRQYRVVVGGGSQEAFLAVGAWDTTAKGLRCFYADYDRASDGKLIEMPEGIIIPGIFNFICLGKTG